MTCEQTTNARQHRWVIPASKLHVHIAYRVSNTKVNTSFFPCHTRVSAALFTFSHHLPVARLHPPPPRTPNAKHGHFCDARTYACAYYPCGYFLQRSLCSNQEYLWITCVTISSFCNFFPACFIYTHFATLSNFHRLINLLSSSQPFLTYSLLTLSSQLINVPAQDTKPYSPHSRLIVRTLSAPI